MFFPVVWGLLHVHLCTLHRIQPALGIRSGAAMPWERLLSDFAIPECRMEAAVGLADTPGSSVRVEVLLADSQWSTVAMPRSSPGGDAERATQRLVHRDPGSVLRAVCGDCMPMEHGGKVKRGVVAPGGVPCPELRISLVATAGHRDVAEPAGVDGGASPSGRVLQATRVRCDGTGHAGDPRRVLSAAVSRVARGGGGRVPASERIVFATLLAVIALAALALAGPSLRTVPRLASLVKRGALDDADAKRLESDIEDLLREMSDGSGQPPEGESEEDVEKVDGGDAKFGAEGAKVDPGEDVHASKVAVSLLNDPRVATARLLVFGGLLVHMFPSVAWGFDENYMARTAPFMVATWSDVLHHTLTAMGARSPVGYAQVKGLAALCLGSLSLSACGQFALPGDLVAAASTMALLSINTATTSCDVLGPALGLAIAFGLAELARPDPRTGSRERAAGALVARMGAFAALFSMLCSGLERAASGWPWAGQAATVVSLPGNSRWPGGALESFIGASDSFEAEIATAVWFAVEISIPLAYISGAVSPRATAWMYAVYTCGVLFAVFQEPVLFATHHMACALLIAATEGWEDDDDNDDDNDDDDDDDDDHDGKGKVKVD